MKKQLVIQKDKVIKRVTYSGTMKSSNLMDIVNKMFKGSTDSDCLFLDVASGEECDTRKVLEKVNTNKSMLAFKIIKSRSPTGSPKNYQIMSVIHRDSENFGLTGSEKSASRRSPARENLPIITINNPRFSPPAVLTKLSLVPVFQLPDTNGFFLVDTKLSPILINTTDISRYKSILVNISFVREEVSFYFQEVKSEYFESIYFYHKGLLHFTLELNDNIDKNIGRFCLDPELFTFVSPTDNKNDHIPVDDLVQVFQNIEASHEMTLEEIQITIGCYNLKPLLFKYAYEEYKIGVIDIRCLS